MGPLCSRNARPQKTLVGRAQWGTHPGPSGGMLTSKLGRAIIVFADGLFEQPANEVRLISWINPDNFLSDCAHGPTMCHGIYHHSHDPLPQVSD